MSEPDSNGIPISSGARRLLTSSKAIIAGLAVIGVIVMNVTGRIESAKALEFITWVLLAYFGAHAAEDAAEKLNLTGGGKGTTISPERLKAILETLAPFLTALMPPKIHSGEVDIPVSAQPLASENVAEQPAPPTPRN